MRRTVRSLLFVSGALAACGDAASPSLLDDPTIVYPAPDWESAPPAQLGLRASALEALASAAEQGDSHCVVLTRKGRIVGEWYWDGWTADTQQPVFSVTKSVTSTLVGIAQDQGKLSVSERASTYISEWQGTDSEQVTLANLLSNDSGRAWSFVGDYVNMAGLADDKTGYAIGLGQDQAPGTLWEYNNSAIQTLERVLAKATGVTDVARFAEEQLFAPLGARMTMGHDAAGNTQMFQELRASCRDLARFGYLYLREGTWADGKQLLSADYVKAATRTSQPLNVAYGYLWWLNRSGHYVLPSAPARSEADGKLIAELPDSTYFALGLGGQVVLVDPEHEIVMTRIGGSADAVGAVTSGSDPVGRAVLTELGRALAEAITD